MVLNICKCQIFSFSRKHIDMIFGYELNNIQIPRSNAFKDLGVTFNRDISFDPHINNIINGASRMSSLS